MDLTKFLCSRFEISVGSRFHEYTKRAKRNCRRKLRFLARMTRAAGSTENSLYAKNAARIYFPPMPIQARNCSVPGMIVILIPESSFRSSKSSPSTCWFQDLTFALFCFSHVPVTHIITFVYFLWQPTSATWQPPKQCDLWWSTQGHALVTCVVSDAIVMTEPRHAQIEVLYWSYTDSCTELKIALVQMLLANL